MPKLDPIRVLTDQHRVLTQLFARHQEALLARAWARAARLLDQYEKHLRSRILVEERYLLPYCLEGRVPGQWSVYVAEHRRLEKMLHDAGERLRAVRRRGMSPAIIIGLLDDEKTMKYVLEHHLDSEDSEFSTSLQRMLPEGVRNNLLRALIDMARVTH